MKKILADKTSNQVTKFQMAEAAHENTKRELQVLKSNIENAKKRKLKERSRTGRNVRFARSRRPGRNMAILLTPIPALLLGIFVFVMRAKDERQGIIPDRLVGRK